MFYAAVNDGLYNTVLVIHIALAIVGFGGVVLNGVYGAQAQRRGGTEGLAITEVNYFVSTRIAEICIYLVPLAGFALVGLSDDAWTYSQTWVWLSIVLYVVGLGVTHSVIVPSVKRTLSLQRELVAGPPAQAGPPPQLAELQRYSKRVAAASSVQHVILLVIIILMVAKPGV